jgi:hypothetical protein
LVGHDEFWRKGSQQRFSANRKASAKRKDWAELTHRFSQVSDLKDGSIGWAAYRTTPSSA